MEITVDPNRRLSIDVRQTTSVLLVKSVSEDMPEAVLAAPDRS
jgi:hypothetical protein